MFESEHFKKQAGLLTFTPSISEWVEQTGAIGLYVKRGKYGGTYAHKEEENDKKQIEWDAKRFLSKNNVRYYATVNELTVSSNLETHNAHMIREGRDKEERFKILKEIAEYQLGILFSDYVIFRNSKSSFQKRNCEIERGLLMTTFICFVIAIVFLYIMRLVAGGFNVEELLSFLLMIVLLGSHVYLTTRKKAIFGITIPLLIVASFYPVYKMIDPAGTTLVVLIVLYVIALGSCLYIWYKARKNDK